MTDTAHFPLTVRMSDQRGFCRELEGPSLAFNKSINITAIPQ